MRARRGARRRRGIAALALAAGVSPVPACAEGDPAPPLAARARATSLRVLLVGIDGAGDDLVRSLVAAGELPTLAGLASRGAWVPLVGGDGLGPVVWNEVLTGRPAAEHGVGGFFRPDHDAGGVDFVSARERETLTLFNVLGACGRTVTAAGFHATAPVDVVAGRLVSDRVVATHRAAALGLAPQPDAVFPASLAQELAPVLAAAVRRAPGDLEALVDLAPDERALLDALDEPLLNHGPSALKFAFAAQRAQEEAFLALLAKGQPDLAAVLLGAFEPVAAARWHDFEPEAFGLDPSPERRRRGAVVPALLRHDDRFLARVLAAVDPATVVLVVGDHGLAAGRRPPRSVPAADFPVLRGAGLPPGTTLSIGRSGLPRGDGFLLAAGGPIDPQGRTEVRPVDLAPTILALLGLPVAMDLGGRTLHELIEPTFFRRHPFGRLASYEGWLERERFLRRPGVPEEDQIRGLVADEYLR